MKKVWKAVWIFVALVICFSTTFRAENLNEVFSQTEEEIGYASFLESIPQESRLWLESAGIDLSSDATVPALSEIFLLCYSGFLSVLGEHVPLFSCGLVLLLLFKLFSSLCVGSSRLMESLAYLIVVSAGIYSFSVIEQLLDALVDVTEQASAFLTASVPVAVGARIWAGSPESATALALSLPPVLAVISTVVSSLFHPLCLFCYASSLCGFYRGEMTLRPIVSSVRRFCVRGVEILSGLAVGVFCVQKAAAASSDTVMRRGVRFALTQILPVAGGALTDGVETVYACGRSLSGKIGVICVLVLFSMFITPCILGFLLMLLYSMLSAVGEFFSVPLLSDFFSDVKDTLAVVTAFSVCSLTVLSSALLLLTGG